MWSSAFAKHKGSLSAQIAGVPHHIAFKETIAYVWIAMVPFDVLELAWQVDDDRSMWCCAHANLIAIALSGFFHTVREHPTSPYTSPRVSRGRRCLRLLLREKGKVRLVFTCSNFRFVDRHVSATLLTHSCIKQTLQNAESKIHYFTD